MPKSMFGMFAKAWQPGAVKTRLGKSIGNETAATIYKAILEYQVARFSVEFSTLDRQLVFAPKEEADLFLPFQRNGWSLHPQAGGDLGNRISEFFRTAFESGYDRVVLIGSDSPDLEKQIIDQAFDALDQCDAVFSPSDDGGYCLVGLSHWEPNFFEQIPWSTSKVLQASVDRLKDADQSVRLLPTWYDVDTLDDLHRLIHSLQQSRCPAKFELASKLNQILQAKK